jgi:hypothetical protein
VNTIGPLAVALLDPPEVELLLPGRQSFEGLEGVAKVLLDGGAEAVDAPLVDQVLEPGLPAIVPAAVVALRGVFFFFFLKIVQRGS